MLAQVLAQPHANAQPVAGAATRVIVVNVARIAAIGLDKSVGARISNAWLLERQRDTKEEARDTLVDEHVRAPSFLGEQRGTCPFM